MEKDSYYRRGDYTGDLRSGEKVTRRLYAGKGGGDSDARCERTHQGKYENGIHDIPPESGHNLKLSIDIELQEYGEQLMRNKIGAIVAIEPSTGEILALVTSPNYDPSLLVGGDRGKNYVSLVNDIYKPLYDRSIQGTYPPGSTFKPTQGLIFLQGRVVNNHTMYPLLPRLCEPSPGRLPRTRIAHLAETCASDILQCIFLLGIEKHD